MTKRKRYSWLNTQFVIAEGEFDEAHNGWSVDCHVCRNTTVGYPPAIGSAPPAGFWPEM